MGNLIRRGSFRIAQDQSRNTKKARPGRGTPAGPFAAWLLVLCVLRPTMGLKRPESDSKPLGRTGVVILPERPSQAACGALRAPDGNQAPPYPPEWYAAQPKG